MSLIPMLLLWLLGHSRCGKQEFWPSKPSLWELSLWEVASQALSKTAFFRLIGLKSQPGVLMLAMGCAEIGSDAWLILATALGFPVSTTQTVVGGG